MGRGIDRRSRRRWYVPFLFVLVIVFGSFQQTRAQTTGQTGDQTIGESLFEGSDRFDNGGPPCLACHSVAGIGALGGGALGPDLTGAFDKFGEEGIVSILATTPFPTMRPIFDDQPLTEEEQTHLAEFLKGVTVSEREASAVGQLAALGAVGAAVLLLATRLIWRGPPTNVRRPMVVRSRTRIDRARLARGEADNAASTAEGR